MVSRTKLTVLVGSVVLLTALLALGLATVSAAPGVDLGIYKEALGRPGRTGVVIAGEELIYEIRVHNGGDTGATDVWVDDYLPPQVIYLGSNPEFCTWTGSNPLTCDLGDMAPYERRYFEVKVLVKPDAVADELDGTITMDNYAQVGSEDDDEDPSDNTFNHSIFVEDSADLSVIKMSKPDLSVEAGEYFTYTIIVENLGPSFARGVRLVDNIVSSGAFTVLDWQMNRPGACKAGPYEGYDGEVWFCALAAGEGLYEPLEPKGYFNVGEEPFDGGGQWIVQLTVVASDTQEVNNFVNVFTYSAATGDYTIIGTPDPDLSNNSAEDFISVEDVANLSLDKAVEPPTGYYYAGDEVQFRLTVDNVGPSTAEGVVVEDYLPAGVTLVQPMPDGCNGGTPGDPTDPLVCYLGDIAPDDAATVLNLHMKIDPDYPVPWDYPSSMWLGYLRNDAWVYSDILDPDNSDNLDSRIIQVRTTSSIDINKSCAPTDVAAGAEHEYVVTVANVGPSTVRNFRFTDQLPAGVTYLGFAIEGGGGECVYSGGTHQVQCWLGDIAPGAVGTQRAVHLTVLVNPDAPPGTLSNSVLNPLEADSYINWSGTQSCDNEVFSEPNLSIEKTSEPDKVFPGDQITYDIVVTNDGPSVAPGVLVTDTLPPEVSYEVDTDNCTYLPGDPDLLECDLGALPAGGSSSFQVYVRVDDLAGTGQITNTVTVNHVATDTVRTMIMNPDQADLGLVKNVSPEPYLAGQLVTYTLTVSNTGPLVAQNVVLEDLLPEGLTVVGASASQGSCTTGEPGVEPLVCNLGNLDVDQEVWVQVEAFIDPNYWGPMENDAWVHSEVYDQDEGNNRAHVIVSIDPFSNLWMQKFGPSDIRAGEEIWYNIDLGNDGPSTAHDVYVDDRLPDGVGLIDTRVIVGEGSCVEGTALCSLGDVEPHEGNTIQVHGFVEPWVEHTTVLTNTASLWANSPINGELWPDEFWGLRSEVTTTVGSEADLSIRKTSDPYKVYAGEQKRYDIEVTNLGPSVAYSVTVTDTLPPGVEFELATIGCDYHPPTMLGSTQPWWFEEDEDGENGGALFSVDLGSGAGSLIGQMPEWLAAEIEYDNSTGRLFAAEGFKPWYNDTRPPRLYELDPTTGGELGYVELDEYCALPGLEFVDGTLYGMCSEDPGGDPYLATIDPDTGDVTKVDEYAYVDNLIHGLAYDESSGIMYGLEAHEGSDNELWEIHLGDGDAYPVCDIVESHDFYYEDVHDLRSIEFGPDGLLYGGMAGYESGLVRIDIDDGHCEITRIGDPGFYATGLTWVEGSQSAVCPLGDIPPGETRNFSIFVQVKPDTLGIINNRVDVSSDNDPNDDNDHWSEANLVLGNGDLRVRKYGPHGVVEADEELIYTVVVDNLGPGYAHNVVLYDLFSSTSYAYNIMEVEPDRPANCWWEYWGYDDDARITCRLDDPLEVMSPSSSGRWEVKVYVHLHEKQSINNVVDVVSDDDPDLSNNHAEVENDVEPVADLHLHKEAWGEIRDACDQPPYPEEENSVAAGALLRYELGVCNDGPSTAENVVLEDWGISPLLDITNVWWDYGVSCLTVELGEQGDTNRRLTCYLGYLDPYHDCKSVYLEGRLPSDVPEATRLFNDAMVYGEVYDDENWDNFATNWTTVEVWADLGVEKSQEPEIALPSQDITYSITVTNKGPSDAHGVLISDTLPVQLLDATWTCCASDGECDLPCEPPVCPEEPCPWPDPDTGLFAQADIPADGWVIYTVEGVLDVWPCGLPFTNTVEITAPQSLVHPEMNIDQCTENNDAEAVNPPPLCNFVPLALKSYPGPDSPL